MADATRVDALALECRTFVQYLVGEDPPHDIVAAYQRAHDVSTVSASGLSSRALDQALLRLARVGPVCARAADGYAAVFAKASVLRRKLVLLVAILESRGQTAARIDSAEPGPRAAWILGLSARIGLSLLMLGAATLAIVPLRIWYRLVDARLS
jgi:hypothetical protein